MFFMEQEIKLLNAKIVFSENVPPSDPSTAVQLPQSR